MLGDVEGEAGGELIAGNLHNLQRLVRPETRLAILLFLDPVPILLLGPEVSAELDSAFVGVASVVG